ncbi:MAG: redoxin family protein [Nocardiopsaceae bacterium]|nr:redoxin family protein [Nocardiopsaceae bacterium]
MSPVWEAAALAGWAALLLNLALTLRLVRWFRSYQQALRMNALRAELPELTVGEPAPPFRARDLSGAPVRSDDLLSGRTALVFVSPHCGTCRRDMPSLMTLAARAERTDGTRMVLVSDSGLGETRSWVSEIRDQDKVDLAVPVLLASGETSGFLTRYNPRRLTPYFCHIDDAGNVTARGPLHSPAWTPLVRRWNAAAHSAQY